MSLVIDPEMNHHKKSFHRRHDSSELDVFEAARYFSGYNEVIGYSTNNSTQKMMMMREETRLGSGQGQHRGRISLDMPMRSLLPQQFHGVVIDHHNKQQQMKEKKLQKQPSSPGGKLATFLNSLFSQSSSKKKKSQSMKDEDESPGGRRRSRRSSISHFRSSSTTTFTTTSTTTTSADSTRSLYSSLSSGFRTPPPYVQTPTKGCKEFKRNMSTTKHNNDMHVKSSSLENEFWRDDKKKREGNSNYYKHCSSVSSSNVLVEKKRNNNKYSSAEEKGVVEEDGGAESDSSSDLFELPNYDLGYYSSGLPVYETTNMDNIKRGALISNV